MRIKKECKKKFVSSLVNVLLVLSVLIILFPLCSQPAKAVTIRHDDWVVIGTESYSGETFILYGDLRITTGKLTLNNCIIEMAYEDPDNGSLIDVDGEFYLLNNSLITTYSTSPDPYEFRIDGTALIENSTVEKMRTPDLPSDPNGIQIDSNDVKITNSTVQLSGGTGVFVKNGSISITNSSIINNNHWGVLLYSDSSNNNIIDSNFSSNTFTGIWIQSSSYNNIIGNRITSNGGHGMYLYLSSHNNITHNNISSNDDYGIWMRDNNNYNYIFGNTISLNDNYGIYIKGGSEYNDIIGNTISSNVNNGILLGGSNNNIIDNNITSNSQLGLVHAGIYIWGPSGNTITGNNISSNFGTGIYGSYSSNNNLTGNNIFTNNNNGINLYSSSNYTITGNNVSSNDNDGIYLHSSNDNKIGMNSVVSNSAGINLTSSSNSNLVTNNYLFNNTNYGLYMTSSDLNEIIDNNITSNKYGAYLDSTTDNNTLYHNNFDNKNINATDYGSDNKWDNGLEGNWWGDMGDYTDSDGDGICDSNYTGTNFVDNLPLANEDNDRVLVDDPWFWFIQSGVNFAEIGWTVYATPSTYLENVTIDKTLTVIGEDKNTTIINARSAESVVLVDHTSYVNVSGFTVMNGINGFYLNNSDYCIIDDNIITSNAKGVNLTQSSDNTIGNNSILYNGFGIYLIESNNTLIRINDISNSTNAGYHISLSYDIIMEYNSIINNDAGGRLFNSSFLIQYNDISYNSYGIQDVEYSFGNICNNTISYNYVSGITHAGYSNISINNNTISYNYYGIECISSSYAIITYNNITFNTIGIDSSYGSNETIHWNNIHNNTLWNITNWDSTILINATDNYWGSDDPIEIANGINGQVIYDPYKSDPIEEAGPQ